MKLLDRILGRGEAGPNAAPFVAAGPQVTLAEGSTTVTPYSPLAGRIMVTNGGPHPPDAWAHVTAQHLAPVDPNTTGARHTAAVKLQVAIAEALLPHHTAVQALERGKLQTVSGHLLTQLNPEPHLDDAVKAIQDAAKGSLWEDHFHQPEIVSLIRQELGCHFASVQHIERSWHVDRNPGHRDSQSWLEIHHPGSVS
jgi:hypothetical protein